MAADLDPRWDLLTLDTSCVSALANPEATNDPAEVRALDRIIDLARDGRIRVQVTSAYDRDFSRWKDPVGRESRLGWLANAPPLPRAPGVFRLDVSLLGGGDVLGGDGDVEFDQELRSVLLPTLAVDAIPSHEEAPNRAAKVFSDIDHLTAHRLSGADAFVTLDASTILNRREVLRRLGMVVCKPREALPRCLGS
jgi:hypothetical protein